MEPKERILSEDVRDILVDYAFLPDEIRLSFEQGAFIQVEKELGILYLPLSYENQILETQYRYAYVPKCYGLTEQVQSDLSLESSGIYQMQGRPLKLTGSGVLIGFVDTGIRSSLPLFYKADGSCRIFSVWDQTDQSGVAPDGFYYGSEYRQIDGRLLKVGSSEEETDESITDSEGHGTAVASVALSAASDAQIVMVKCKQAKSYLKKYYGIREDAEVYSEADILTAIAYLEQISLQTGRPLVICFTMGTNMGSHASDSILDQYLSLLGKRRGHGIVISGGNEGNQAHHYKGLINGSSGAGYEDVEILVSEGVSGFYLELWGESPSVFSISLQSPDGEVLGQIPVRFGKEFTYSFVYSDTVATINYIFSERSSAKQLIFVRLEQPLSGIWTMRVFANKGLGMSSFHVWLPMSGFTEQPVYFLKPDPYLTLTEPAYIENAIGLSYYDAINASISIDSGRGIFLGNQIEPAMSAPGVSVETALGPRSGGSVSAALTAGAVAQFLEWAVLRRQDPLINSLGIRNYFIRGANREKTIEYPNPIWGYGKLNLEGVFDALMQ